MRSHRARPASAAPDGVANRTGDDQRAGARHSEFRYGRFWRVLTLPPGAREADIEARYKDGILEVRVPVTDSAPVASRRIPVKQG